MEKDLTQKCQFLRCLIRLVGGLTRNETLSHSNGKFIFDHGPKDVKNNIYFIFLYQENLTFDFLSRQNLEILINRLYHLSIIKDGTITQ